MNNAQLGATQKARTANQIPSTRKELQAASRPVVSYSGTQQNELLAALPRQDMESLFEHLELVPMPFGKELFEYGSKLEYVYFPTTAIVSLLYVM
jgi:hypothetical protein